MSNGNRIVSGRLCHTAAIRSGGFPFSEDLRAYSRILRPKDTRSIDLSRLIRLCLYAPAPVRTSNKIIRGSTLEFWLCFQFFLLILLEREYFSILLSIHFDEITLSMIYHCESWNSCIFIHEPWTTFINPTVRILPISKTTGMILMRQTAFDTPWRDLPMKMQILIFIPMRFPTHEEKHRCPI